MTRDEFAQQFIQGAASRGASREDVAKVLPQALADFDKNQAPAPMTSDQALAKQVPLNQPVPPSPQVQGLLPQVAQFLMPNAVSNAQNMLQQVGAGNQTPTQPSWQSTGASALGPLGETLLGTPQQQQQQAGNREMAATYKGVVSGVGLGGDIVTNAGKTLTNIAGAKSLNPMKVTGYGREQAMKAAGNLDTTSLIKAGDEFIAKNPLAKDVWEAFKPTITPKMDATDLVGRMTDIFSQAYTKSGDVRSTAEATLLNKLYQSGKSVIQAQAPEVAKYTGDFRTLMNAPKKIQQLSWLALKLSALGTLLHL